MRNFKLSKQTIFTLLGVLVIVGSIPLAVILVKQRQEIRKEAATQTCGDWCVNTAKSCGGGPPCCTCNNQNNPGYKMVGATPNVSDCGVNQGKVCYAWVKESSSQPAVQPNNPASTASEACYDKSGCTNLGGRCGNPSSCTGNYQTKTDLCPSGKDCVCCAPKCGQRCINEGAAGGGEPYCYCTSDKSTKTVGGKNYVWVKTLAAVDCSTCSIFKLSGTTQTETGNNNTTGGTAQGSGEYPVWGLLETGRVCSIPKTDTPPPTTPTSKKICNQTCSDDSSCQSPLKCLTKGSAKYCLNNSCPSETDCTCPGPTPTNTSTPTPTATVTPTSKITVTPTPTTTVTPTPTIPVGCDQSCTTNNNCNGDLICSSGRCRNEDCTGETDCSCPGPTSTPTPTSGPTSTPTLTGTPGPTSTPTTSTFAQATPTPVVQLPQAGFAWPTFGAIFGGMAFILIASLLFLL